MSLILFLAFPFFDIFSTPPSDSDKNGNATRKAPSTIDNIFFFVQFLGLFIGFSLILSFSFLMFIELIYATFLVYPGYATINIIFSDISFFVAYFLTYYCSSYFKKGEEATWESFFGNFQIFAWNLFLGLTADMSLFTGLFLLSGLTVSFPLPIYDMILYFLIVPIQAYVEEKLFRGVVHKELSQRFGSWMSTDPLYKMLTIAFCSALLFSIIHLPFIWQVSLTAYTLHLMLYLPGAFVYGLIHEQEKPNPTCKKEESESGLGFVTGSHAGHNIFLYTAFISGRIYPYTLLLLITLKETFLYSAYTLKKVITAASSNELQLAPTASQGTCGDSKDNAVPPASMPAPA